MIPRERQLCPIPRVQRDESPDWRTLVGAQDPCALCPHGLRVLTFLSVLLGLPFVGPLVAATATCQSDRNDPTSATCHPDPAVRDPIFSSAPFFGASGRAVEGSRFSFHRDQDNGVIPTGATRLLLSRGLCAPGLSSLCHPDPARRDPIFSSAPLFGASGRAVEGSLLRLSLARFSLCPLCSLCSSLCDLCVTVPRAPSFDFLELLTFNSQRSVPAPTHTNPYLQDHQNSN